MQSDKFALGTGALLGNRYRIVRTVGLGGMGSVYLADDLKLPGKQWAVKETRMHIRQKEAFLDEAHVLSRLDHPFLPHIIDYFPPDGNGYCYLVMDFVQGKTLAEALQDEPRFSAEKALRYALQLCEVFDYLHNFRPKPIIYRDLKPSNIMVDEQDNIRLIDFGIARHYSQERVADTVHLGTVGFAAPEQYEEKQTDARTDLYTLGAVLFYLLSGGIHYRPDGENLQTLRPDLPDGFAAVIGKLLQTEPSRRYQTAVEVKAALMPLMTIFSPAAAAESAAGTQSRRVPEHAPVPFQRRVIVVGSLYEGAGATFTAMSLARVLNRYKIRQAVVELPGARPELFHLLDGGRNAPKDYRFRMAMIGDAAATESERWQDGWTEWVPLPPEAPSHAGDAGLCFRLLHLLPQPIVIVDAGNGWRDPAVQELCLRSDMTLVVCGPDPGKLASTQTQEALEFLKCLHASGKPVEVVANRDSRFAGRSEWLSLLPSEPIGILPELPHAEILDWLWKGKPPQDKPEHLQLLDDALQPLVRKLVPGLKRPAGRGSLAFLLGRR